MIAGSGQDCWIESFVKWSEPTGSPKLFRYWTAVSAISGLLERRVLIQNRRGFIAPNVFTLLVAAPGIGKTIIIDRLLKFWRMFKDLRVAPSSITRAGFEDFLKEQTRNTIITGIGNVNFHSGLFALAEFGTFLKEYDNDMINTINDLWDCRDIYDFRTRGKGATEIANPHITILAGTQPQYLQHTFPPQAFGMGFTSRMMMVYADKGQAQELDFFDEGQDDEVLFKRLERGAASIFNMRGIMQTGKEVKDFVNQMGRDGWKPKPDNPKLEHYNTRRPIHVIKTAMCFAAARAPEAPPELLVQDVAKAFALILETEKTMPEIFTAMVTSGVTELNIEILNFIIGQAMRDKDQKVDESVIFRYMGYKLPSNMIVSTLDLMVRSGYLTKSDRMIGNTAVPAYKPHTGTEQVRNMLERAK